MANYTGLGLLQGLRQGFQDAENRDIAADERTRRNARADEIMGLREAQANREQQTFADQQADRATAEQEHGEDRAYLLKQRAQQATAEQQKASALKGYHYLTLLGETGDPQKAAAVYQRVYGEPFDASHIPAYDAKTGTVTLPSSAAAGAGATIPLDRLKAHYAQIAGLQPAPDKPVVVGQGDTLVDPKTGKPIFTSPKAAGDNFSKYNPQRAYDQISGNIAEVLGGQFDSVTGKYTVPAGQSQRFSAATAMAQSVEHEHPNIYPPGVLAKAALHATADLVTPDAARQQAEQEAAQADTLMSHVPLVGNEPPWKKQGLTKQQWINQRAQQIAATSAQQVRARFQQAFRQLRPGPGLSDTQRSPAAPPQQTAGLSNVARPRVPAAPQTALDFLKSHPNLAPQFKAKYGYLPSWAQQVPNGN